MKKSKLFRRSTLILAVIALAVALTVGVIAGVAMLNDEPEQTTSAPEYGEHCSNIQVSTSGKVSLKFKYSTLGKAGAFVYEVVDQSGNISRSGVYTAAEVEENGNWVAVALAPSEMMCTVNVYPADASGDNRGKPMSYSVKQYATEVLANENYAEYHDAMRALLNWGSYAQTKFNTDAGVAVGTLPHASLYLRNSNPIYGVNSISYEKGEVVPGSTIKGVEMNLSLEPGNIVLHFYVNYTGNGTLKATVSKNGGEAVPTNVSKTDKGYLVRVTNVPASLFDTPYTITITDDEDTFTATKTIREYLGILLADCNAKVENKGLPEAERNAASATGNVVRAMYQLYQVVTGNTGADTCKHNQNFYYWVADGENTATVKCNHCHTVLGAGIDNAVNAYAHAGTLQNAGPTGSVDKELMAEDGVKFVRYDNFYANRDNWGDIGLTSTFTGKTGVTGQYMVVKFRVGSVSNGRSNLEFYANTNKGGTGTTGLVTAASTQIVETNDNQWHTVIINLAERVKEPSKTFVDEGDGTYNVRYLSVRMFSGSSVVADDSAAGRYAYTYSYTYDDNGTTKTGYETFFGAPLTEEQLAEKVAARPDYQLVKYHKQSVAADAYVDIAYIALCDSAEEAKTLIDTDVYEVSTANDKSMYYNTVDDSCAHFSRDAKEYVNGSTYGYNKCAQCGEYEHSKTLPDSVKFYFSPSKISTTGTGHPTNARVHYNMINKAFVSESNNAYFSFTGKDDAAQFIWNRVGYSADQAYTMDIGKAQYVVIKMRLSNTNLSKNWGFNFSTTGASSHTYNALPVTASTAGEWATYVVDLAKVFGSYYAPDAETGNYLVDVFYLHSDKLMKTDKIDIAYIAFVEGDWKDVVDTNTAIVQTTRNGAGNVVDIKTGKCVDDKHSLSVHDVDGTYKYACDACGTVIRDTGVKVDAVGLLWAAEDLYKRGTSSVEASYWTGGPVGKELITEDGETFFRITDMKTNGQWGGWFPVDSNGNYPHAGVGRYMVIKVRQNDNSINKTSLPFWISSAGSSGSWASGSFEVYLPEDNQWHVIVVDLAARAGGYTTDANGEYGIKTVHLRPFGGYTAMDSVHDEVMDIAYMAFFHDLSDLKDIIGEDVFEMSQTSSSSLYLNTETLTCAHCTPVYVSDAEDDRGYHYECSACGKVFAIDFYTSNSGRRGYGSATVSTKYDLGGFKYQSFLSSGSGSFLDYINNSGPGGGGVTPNAVNAGRYLVIKLRGETTADVPFYIGTDDIAQTNSNYQGTSLGKLTPETMPTEWTIAVIDLAGLARYSLGETHKLFLSSTTGGGTLTPAGAQVDIAYAMVVSNVEDALEITGDEPLMFYGNSFYNTPEVLDTDCGTAGHTYTSCTTKDADGKNNITYTCVVCGNTDLKWISSLDSMSLYLHSMEKNLYDEENDVYFNRYSGNGGNHLNLTGGGGAGSVTTGLYQTGKYFAIKYRVVTGMRTTSLGLNIATGDKKDGNGASLGTQYIYANQNLSTPLYEQGEWRVAFIDASVDRADKAEWTFDGSMQSIYVMITIGGEEYVVDIAWAAVVDSQEALVSLLQPGETYFAYGESSWSTAGGEMNQDGTCISHVCSEAISGSTYKYTCNTCKTVVKQYTLDSSVIKYYSANQLNTTAQTYYGGSHLYKWDDVHSIAYMDTTVVQTIWQRMDHDLATTQTAANGEQYSENVGNAKYLVVKARSSDAGAYIMFNISTMAKNCEIGTITEADFTDGVLNATKAAYKKIDENGKTETATCAEVGDQYYYGTAMVGIYLMGKGEATGEWVTYVIDLETVCDGFYEKVEGQDYYDVDTFYFHNGGTSQIAYVAFVEGSWAEIDALVEEDVVMQITAGGGEKASVGQLVNVADGSLAE